MNRDWSLEGVSSADMGEVLEAERQDELDRCRSMIAAIFYGHRETLDYWEATRILMATGMPNEEARRFIDDREETD